MVACADNFNVFIAGYIDIFYTVVCGCAVYLYAVLGARSGGVGAGLPARDGTGVNTRAAKAAPTALDGTGVNTRAAKAAPTAR